MIFLAVLQTFLNRRTRTCACARARAHTHTHTHTHTVVYEEQISISNTSDKLKSTNFHGQFLAIHFQTSVS